MNGMSKEILIKEMLEQPVWAVVGATKTKDKFGYRILRRLQSAGYKTYAVNPFYQEIEGEVCYPSLKALPTVPDCINMVVSPDKAETFIIEAAELGIKKIWFQPGAFDQNVIDFAESKGLKAVYYSCVLVELGKIGK
jgi:predicted CoA-binding protein